jgi:hypothetical protein
METRRRFSSFDSVLEATLMQRLLFLLIVVLVLAACRGDDDKSNNNAPQGSPTATEFVRATLPEAQNVTAQPLTSTPTSSAGISSGQATTQPANTSGIDPNRPTLPPEPSATPSVTSRPRPTRQPTATATEPYEPPSCVTFRPDTDQNLDSYELSRGIFPSIYWFPPQGQNITYEVRLFTREGVRLLLENNITDRQEFTFDPEVFPQTNKVYQWTVKAFENGVDMGCNDLDGELVIKP